MRRSGSVGLVLLACGIKLAAQHLLPQREITAHEIVSRRDPALRIILPPTVQYVGADRWLLFNVADCEIELFVEADARKRVTSYYWIQFEGFVPSEPNMSHNYKPSQSAELGGMSFDVRARAGPTDEVPKAGSDLEHVVALLRGKGYTLPAGMMNVRLLHMLDDGKRKELMVIYAEDVSPTGFTAQELYADSKGQAAWPKIQRGLVARAEEKISFRVP